MKISIKIQIVLLLGLLLSCGKKLKEVEPVPSLRLETGDFNLVTLGIESEIISVGDGIVEVGHVWSQTTDSPTIDNSTSESRDTFIDQATNFTSTISNLPSQTFHITAFVKDIHDCYQYGKPEEVVISVDPVINFDYDSGDCTGAPCTVTFDNKSTGADTYCWDFGDGSPIIDMFNITHEFELPGTYVVTLTGKNEDGMVVGIEKDTILIPTDNFVLELSGFNAAKGIVRLADGSYLVACTQNVSSNDTDAALIRITKDGEVDESFTKTYHFSEEDEVEDMIQLGDDGLGDIIMVGSTLNSNGDKDILYIRVTPQGDLALDQNENPTNIGFLDTDETGSSVLETTDGKIAIVGKSNNNLYLLKKSPDLDFNYIDNNSFDIPGLTEGIDLVQTSSLNNDFIIVGKQNNGNNTRIFLSKHSNSTGEFISGFPRFYNYNTYNDGYAITEVDGAIVFGGSSTASNASPTDIYLEKTNLEGDDIFLDDSFPYTSGTSGISEICFDLTVMDEGTITSVGFKDGDAHIIKINSNGIIENTFGGNGPDFFNKVIAIPDGGFITVGSLNGNAYIVKTDENLEAFN